MYGADGHGFERVEFLSHLHRANFGGKRGAGATNDNDGGDQWAKFAGHGDSHRGGHVADGTKLAQLVGRLESENQANEKGDEGKNGKCAHTNFESLRDGALKTDGLALKRADEGVVRGATAKRGERADVSQSVDDGPTDLVSDLHADAQAMEPAKPFYAAKTSTRALVSGRQSLIFVVVNLKDFQQ